LTILLETLYSVQKSYYMLQFHKILLLHSQIPTKHSVPQNTIF